MFKSASRHSIQSNTMADQQEQQQQQEAAAVAVLLADDPQQLADLGSRQAQQLLQTGKEILDAYGKLQPSLQALQAQQQLQDRYLQLSQDIRATLKQCRALEIQEAAASREAAAAEAGPTAAAAAAAGSDPGDPESLLLAQLEAEAAELRQQLQAKNALIKRVVDRLRHLLDAFAMWDSHQRHLLQHALRFAAAGSGLA